MALSTIPRTSLLPSFVFVWPSNWGSGCLIEITAVSPSRMSLASEVILEIGEQTVLVGVVVDRPGQRGFESGKVGSALAGVDVVREGVDRPL